ncbi:hypothetical protein [Algoriphagus aquimarinus]|uniref:hypothetical protein n=1 Tax=Algoriphagus aquimarinus TaxID=237018 RepID=UPI0030DA6AD9|tara:strand:+ start:1319 stop:2341 length:1023 start_codon:yes stop_codon:yes gene_type:complete
MRIIIGLGIVVFSVLIFGWWGLISLIIALPFIGWPDRHKGPFPTSQRKSSNYSKADRIANEIPSAFRSIQDLLVEIDKKSLTSDELHVQLHMLTGTLRFEKYSDSRLTDKDMLFEVMNQFSEAFPNWQKEHAIIHEAIQKEFGNKSKNIKEKQTDSELAMLIFKLAKQAQDEVDIAFDRFLSEHSNYQHNKNMIRDEIQWIPYVAGILAVFVNFDLDKKRKVIDEMTEIWKNKLQHTDQTKEIYKRFSERMDAYFTRFNRGISYRDSEDLMKIMNEGLFDCANEGIYFFTDKTRSIEDMDFIMLGKVEPRQAWGILEIFVRETLVNYFYSYTRQIQKLKG